MSQAIFDIPIFSCEEDVRIQKWCILGNSSFHARMLWYLS